MSKIRRAFEQKGFEESQYNQYYRRNQIEYKRIKLRSVLLYSQGNEFAEIAKKLDIHSQSVRKYVNLYITGGFEALCQKVKRPQSSRLNPEQCASFRSVLLSKRPCQVGLTGNYGRES